MHHTSCRFLMLHLHKSLSDKLLNTDFGRDNALLYNLCKHLDLVRYRKHMLNNKACNLCLGDIYLKGRRQHMS